MTSEYRDCNECGDVFTIDGGTVGHFVLAGTLAGHRFTGPNEARRDPTLPRGWTCRHCVNATPDERIARRVAVALKP